MNMAIIPILLAAAQAAGPVTRNAEETLGAFVGTWTLELMADTQTFGDRGGAGAGSMRCSWGPLEVWVDCELDAHYAAMGRYVLKIVLYRTGADGRLGAFVTNSFGGGRLYSGRWQSENELVYDDAWIDPARKWPHQRTTYTFGAGGEISFSIEVSSDGVGFLPHSGGTYRRNDPSTHGQ